MAPGERLDAPDQPIDQQLVVLTVAEVEGLVRQLVEAGEAFASAGREELAARYVYAAHHLRVTALERPAWVPERRAVTFVMNEFLEAGLRG